MLNVKLKRLILDAILLEVMKGIPLSIRMPRRQNYVAGKSNLNGRFHVK